MGGENGCPAELLDTDPAARLSAIFTVTGHLPAYPKGERWEGHAVGLIYMLSMGGEVLPEWIEERWQAVVAEAPESYVSGVLRGLEER